MGLFTSNINQYNISSEAELSNILSNFNEQMIYNIVEDNINNRFTYAQMNMPNIVASTEANFKQLLFQFPSESETIRQTRDEFYNNILNILCKRFNLVANYNNIIDLYSVSFHLYRFLVCEFRKNVISLFVNFIIKEKNTIYDSLNLAERKKNKDSSTIYNKKLFKNTKLAIIASNLEYVIQCIFNMNIPFESLLNIIYMNEKNTSKTISLTICPMGDFFREQIITLFQSELGPLLLTDIRLQIHSVSVEDDNINI